MGDAQPTFSWTGIGQAEGPRIYYTSFNFSGELYSLGDCVYLLPEEEGAAPYIAKLLRAWEDSTASDAEKLIIEVQWFERRSPVLGPVCASMHEHEVVQSDLTDTNLVGCLDQKAVIIKADSYGEACELLPASCRGGEWYFCRGVLDSDTQCFRSYRELLGAGVYEAEVGLKGGSDPNSQLLLRRLEAAHMPDGQFLGLAHYSNGHGSHRSAAQQQQQQQQDEEMPDAADHNTSNSSHKGPSSRAAAAAAAASGPAAASAANSRSRRAAAAARVAAAAAAAGASSGGGVVRGIPGKVCCECGAAQTPQWREGPLGPKTLCNACGVRYQRSQSKAKSNKRQASERGRGERSSPLHSRAPKQPCLSRSAAPGSTAAAAANESECAGFDAAAAAAAVHGHGTRSSAGGKGGKAAAAAGQQQQQQRNGVTSLMPAAQQQQHQYVHLNGSSGPQQQQKGGKKQQGRRGVGSGAAAAAAGMCELHYYEDEGSPPHMNTHILEELEEEEEGGMQQQLLRDTLNRSATHEAADVLQTLSVAPQLLQPPQLPAATRPQQQQLHALQQQQQQQQMHVSAAFCSSVIGSPSSSMLLSEQLQPDSMPLLSLDDKLVGPDGVLTGLTGPDSLEPGLTASLNPINTHSLSPMQPRRHRLSSSTTGGGSTLGAAAAAAAAAASAVCASPGRLIAAMVQGLKLPAPLNLNGPGPAMAPQAAMSAVSAAAGSSAAGQGQQQQQQQVTPSLLSASLLGGHGTSKLSVGLHYQHLLAPSGTGLLLPLIGSSSNLALNSSSSAAATNTIAGLHGCESQPASAAVSSCEGAPAAAGAGLAGQQQSSSCCNNNHLLAQLRSLVYRASAYTPDAQGLSGLYPGPSSPRAMQHLVQQLDQLPQPARVQLQQVSAAVEENLSKATAAEAAVLAVTQVLAAKKQAAADARQEVERSVLQFRALLGQVSPAVAAAAAGNGCSSANGVYCSPTPGAVGGTGCGCTAVSSAATTVHAVTAGSDSCLVGSSRLGANSPKVLVSQGLAHPTQGFDLSTEHYTSAAACDVGVQGLGDGSDADDLIRDPDDDNAAAAAAAAAVAAAPVAAAAAAAAVDAVQQQQQKVLGQQGEADKQQPRQREMDQQQLDQVKQQQQDQNQDQTGQAAAAVPAKPIKDHQQQQIKQEVVTDAEMKTECEQQQLLQAEPAVKLEQEGAAASASASSDGAPAAAAGTAEAAVQQQQQQQQAFDCSSFISCNQQQCNGVAAVPAVLPPAPAVSAPPPSAAHSAAETAPVAA